MLAKYDIKIFEQVPKALFGIEEATAFAVSGELAGGSKTVLVRSLRLLDRTC